MANPVYAVGLGAAIEVLRGQVTGMATHTRPPGT